MVLYKLRKEQGLTQKDMAQKLHISEATYRQKELGQSEFKSSEMFLIADTFNKEIGEIFLATKPTNRG